MLKKNAQLFEGLFTATDLAVVSAAWIISYWIRFVTGWIPVEKGIPSVADYLKVLLFVWIIWAFVFRRFGLYRPMRGTRRAREVWLVVKANSFAVLIFLAMTYLFREKSVPFSRLVFAIFWITSTSLLILSRSTIRQLLRVLRSRGYNLRYVLVVGAGELAAKVVRRMRMHPEYGVQLLGCLAGDCERISVPVKSAPTASTQLACTNGNAARMLAPDLKELPSKMIMVRPQGERTVGLKVVGHYDDLPFFLDEGRVDAIIVALPLNDHDRLPAVIESIGDSMVDVKIVPDYHQFIRLGSLVEEFEGLPVVSVDSTPLTGINRVAKRIFDIVMGSLFLLFALPIMGLAALLVKVTSRGPVFYSQERVGLDGQPFTIYKIRTMYTDAELAGAKFAVKGDPRVTPIGRLLRKFNIDELPQLFNVIRGHMSLVGPRPERPVFIGDFRKQFPRYMLRHKVQAGMTGWAQVNGWRGNTSIERRVEHDLYYIENWSLALDLKILGMTFLHSFRDNNAY